MPSARPRQPAVIIDAEEAVFSAQRHQRLLGRRVWHGRARIPALIVAGRTDEAQTELWAYLRLLGIDEQEFRSAV